MSYVMLGGDAKKQQLAQSKEQAKQRQQAQQPVAQQPVEQPPPFQPAPPPTPSSGGFFANLFYGNRDYLLIGGGALLVGGIGYAIWQSRKKA